MDITPPSPPPRWESESVNQQYLEFLVQAVTTFLQTEIRNRTAALIHSNTIQDESRSEPWSDASFPIDPYGAIANPQRIQNTVDRYEHWLFRDQKGHPVSDPVFQKIAWLCAVAHGVMPGVIEDARNCTEQELKTSRLEYAETIYTLIRNYVMRP